MLTQKDIDTVREIHNQAYRVKCQVLEGGKMPFKKNQTDAGFDLYATSDFTVSPGEIVKHPVNVRLELPKNTYAEITTKSGLGLKGVLVYAGIIDEEYRGIPHVIMTSLGNNDVSFKAGDKIAQLIVHPYSSYYFMEQVDVVSTDTARGAGGFGSTGAR